MHKKDRRSLKDNKGNAPAESQPAPPAEAPAKQADKPTEKKVVNKFAALDFSDSD